MTGRAQHAAMIAGFAALAGYACWHWFALIADPPVGRWAVCVGATVGGAVALEAVRRVERPAARRGLALAIVAAVLAVGLLAIGVPVRLLAPGAWDELRHEIANGLAGVSDIELPYSGQPWTRIGILVAAPMALAAATAVAFWPTPGALAARRALALILLVALYGVAVTWKQPTAELLRGFGLLLCVAAFAWLPRLRMRGAAVAAVAVAIAGAAAVPAAASVGTKPLVEYTDWKLFGEEPEVTFEWNHLYGPLDWQQRGIDVFEVTGASHPLYWKTWVLDEFDGVGWSRGDRVSELVLSDIRRNRIEGATPALVGRRQQWVEQVEVSLAALRSTILVTTGTTLGFEGVAGAPSDPDGTTPLLEEPLEEGDTYQVAAYAPDPSVRLLRRVDGGRYPSELARFTTLGMPAADAVEVPLRGSEAARAGRPAVDRAAAAIAASPYARVRELALRLTRNAPGNYEAVTRIQRHLLSRYAYLQDVPEHEYPLTSFLFEDRAGYCQHFSGTLGLMLRLIGIPSRVVSGFAPGTPAGEEGAYVIRDEDAHSWVEVWFPKVGWVTVDPTPAIAPAATETAITGAINPDAVGAASARAFTLDQRRAAGRGSSPAADRGDEGGSSAVGLVLGLLLAALAVAASVAYARRRRHLHSATGLDDQVGELARALPELGHPLPRGATLLAIERRLRSAIGPRAADYAAALRQSRYRAGWKRRPGHAERRDLRRSLARGRGPRGRLRAFRAIPPGGPTRP